MSDSKGLDYRQAGVDIDAGNELVKRVGPLAAATRRPEMLGSIGGFGALTRLPTGYKQPVLVSGTDGVGTKTALGPRWRSTRWHRHRLGGDVRQRHFDTGR